MALPIAPAMLSFKLVQIDPCCKPAPTTYCLTVSILRHVCLNTLLLRFYKAKPVAQGGVDVAPVLQLCSAAQDVAWAESSLLAATARCGKSLLALASQKLCKKSGWGRMMVCSSAGSAEEPRLTRWRAIQLPHAKRPCPAPCALC